MGIAQLKNPKLESQRSARWKQALKLVKLFICMGELHLDVMMTM